VYGLVMLHVRQLTQNYPLCSTKLFSLVTNAVNELHTVFVNNTDGFWMKWLLLKCQKINNTVTMFRKLRELYKEYKPYVRVDLIMYAVLILMIILYFIYSVVIK